MVLRQVGKYVPPAGNQAGAFPDFSAAVVGKKPKVSSALPKYTPPPADPIMSIQPFDPAFSAQVESVAAPAAQAADNSWMQQPALQSFIQEGQKAGYAGNRLKAWVMTRAFPNGLNFGGTPKPKPNTGTGDGQKADPNAPLMAALSGYAKNMGANTGMDSINSLFGKLLTDIGARGQSQQDAINQFYGGAETQLGGLNADALAMLQNQYNQVSGEIGTQSDAGRTTIDESTQRALAALGGQSNPYAGLQMADVGAVTDPMAAYSQAVGAPQGGIDALQQMLQSQNAATRGGFGNLAQLLGASNQAAQQSRIGDVNVARAGAQQDLSANQRAASLQALQQSQQARQAQQGTYAQQLLGLGQNRLQANLGAQQSMGDMLNQLQQAQLQSQLGQQQNTQGRQDTLMQQLLGLAGQGIDVSQIMALLGGQ
jgi:hypothetical protein